ncbi:MAG TPA: phytoene/squalene synthase family protein [Tepidisphaeraceae bacterium]|jgi:phytoene synthase
MNATEPDQVSSIDASLDRSRAYCEEVTKTYARNFYYGLRLLPAEKRASMYALYAWMRLVDDIADHEDGRPLDQRGADLEQWRLATHAALNDDLDAIPAPPAEPETLRHSADLWPGFRDMVARHGVPALVFDEVIAGQLQDLRPIAFHTFEQLEQYCYRVAGVVGLASIYVWGFRGGAATERLAVERGLAFQLTNILRDLREDARRGRFYLPLDETAAANLSLADLRAGSLNGRFEEMMRRQIDRAEDYYRRSAPLEELIDPDSRPTLVAMTEIYHSLLRKIARRPSRVLRQRVSLSVFAKLRIGYKALRRRP